MRKNSMWSNRPPRLAHSLTVAPHISSSCLQCERTLYVPIALRGSRTPSRSRLTSHRAACNAKERYMFQSPSAARALPHGRANHVLNITLLHTTRSTLSRTTCFHRAQRLKVACALNTTCFHRAQRLKVACALNTTCFHRAQRLKVACALNTTCFHRAQRLKVACALDTTRFIARAEYYALHTVAPPCHALDTTRSILSRLRASRLRASRLHFH